MNARTFKEVRRTYGFDEVAIAPGAITINPELADIDFNLDGMTFSAPVMASAMDAIVSPESAVEFDRHGGLAVLNLEGVQTKYDDPEEVLAEIVASPQEEVTKTFQRVYSAPIKEDLVGERVRQIKQSGAKCAVSVTPANTKRLAPLAVDAGADVLVVQSTVTTARHKSRSIRGLRLPELLEMVNVPVIVGNCATYDVALEIMETGIHGVLVGIGPGAACTTREVTGMGVPQVTSTLDCAAAREEYYRRSGRYVPIVTDGGIRTGGGPVQVVRRGGRRRDDRHSLRADDGGPRTGLQLGHGESRPDPATRHASERRHEGLHQAGAVRPVLEVGRHP